MPRRVEILKRKTAYQKAFFRVEEVTLRHERFDGEMTDPIERVCLDRGDSVAAVIHDVAAEMLILVEQFRFPTHDKGPGWMLELPAGVVMPDEQADPARTMRRELREEIGYEVDDLRPINTFYPSPGGSSERIHLYYARVSPAQRVGDGGGLSGEGEYVRRVTLPVREALARLERGEILDGKTLIGLQWLQAHHAALVKTAIAARD